MFTLVRPVLLVFFGYRMYVCDDDTSGHPLSHLMTLWVSFTAGAVLNYYWFYKILTGALALVRGDKKKSKKVEEDGHRGGEAERKQQ